MQMDVAPWCFKCNDDVIQDWLYEFNFPFLSSTCKAEVLSSWFFLSLELKLHKRQHFIYMLMMDQSLGRHKSSKIKPNEKIPVRGKNNGNRSHKCNHCDFASSWASTYRNHLKMHSGEKPNKCNQCNYASIHAGSLRVHLKAHSGEKSNKCNQCYFASSYKSALMKHLKTHLREKWNQWDEIDYMSNYSIRFYL